MVGVMEEVLAAHRLATLILDGRIRTGSLLSRIYEINFPGLGEPQLVDAALDILRDNHWIKVVERPVVNGSEQPVLIINPRLYSERLNQAHALTKIAS